MQTFPRYCIFSVMALAGAVASCSSASSPVDDTGTETVDGGAIPGADSALPESDGGSSPDAGSPDGTVPGTDAATTGGEADSGAGGDSGDGGPTKVLGIDPPMGWSSWSFVRKGPTEAVIEAQAKGMHDSGLSQHGFIFVNIDDFYYLDPSKNVDSYGRWVTDTSKFPNGMAAVGDYVHGLGLKFGMYLTPGIPSGAVSRNTPIEGTQAHAADIAITSQWEKNYNFGNVMHYIDYTKTGAQEFVNSWAKLLASWGVDYLKIDGVGSGDVADVQAWSTALKASGRTIHFELSNSLAIADATTWQSISNGWRIDGDVECYCSSTSFPLTNWGNTSRRFTDVVKWGVYSKPNARNDLDSLDIGNGSNDGLTLTERQSIMSLWALSAAPLLLGADLTHLDSTDVGLLSNDEVIAIDQAGVAATQVTAGTTPVWVAKQPDGSLAVGLFNLGGASADVTASWSSLGLTGSANVRDLWQRVDLGSFSGSYKATLPSHGVALLRISK
jgi:alpha-galactosidase